MFYKIMKFSKIWVPSILLIILMMLFAGCASSKAVVGESLNLITDISTAEGLESLAISIKAERLLTYTSVKQPMPLGVALYFPGTALGEIETALTLDSDIVASIKSSELTENGHTSRIEIALKKDAPYEVFREENGLQISFAKAGKTTASAEPVEKKEQIPQDTPDSKAAEVSIPATTTPEEDKDKKPAWVNRVDFSSEDDGKSTIIIGTTRPVKYKMDKAADKRLQLTLFNTNLPDYRKRPLITTRFTSAVDRILPTQTSALKTSSMIVIELRESVPYYIEQADDLLLVHFDASSILPKPLEQADLPSWKKAIAQTTALGEEIEDKKAEDKVLRPKVARKYTGKKIALDFYDTDIKNVFLILMEVSGKNFAIDKDVTGRVTLTLAKPVPWDQALDLILKMNQLSKTSEGDIIRITTLETLKKEDEVLQAMEELEPLVKEYIPIKFGDGPKILEELEKTKSARGTVSLYEATNTIIIRDVKAKIEEAKETVRGLDATTRHTPQIMIEARIVEASTDFARELGIRWGGMYDGDHGSAAGKLYGSSAGAAYVDGVSNYAVNLPAYNVPSASHAAGLGFAFSRIAGTTLALDLRLMAMETNAKGKIISTPKILTINGQEARIEQGQRYPYIKGIDEAGNPIPGWEDLVVKLIVTPYVATDNRVTMKIEAEKKDLGLPVASGYTFLTKKIKTKLVVNDGETIVIGGIIKDTLTWKEAKVPFLGDIPVLGWLFKSKYRKTSKSEMLIFITPTIIQLEQQSSNTDYK